MRGPSTADCEKSHARTSIPTANMLRKQQAAACPEEPNGVFSSAK